MSRKRSGGRGKRGGGPKRPEPITFFIDVCLGGRKLAADLREAGVGAELLSANFPRDCADEVWIREVAAKRWVILTQDAHITRRDLEFTLLKKHSAIAFVLTEGELSGARISELFVGLIPKVERILKKYRRPIIYFVTKSGALKQHIAHKRKGRGKPPRPRQPRR